VQVFNKLSYSLEDIIVEFGPYVHDKVSIFMWWQNDLVSLLYSTSPQVAFPLACQLISRLEALHSSGYLHGLVSVADVLKMV
jgi:hypothetical protein